jgi:hypothetical protein
MEADQDRRVSSSDSPGALCVVDRLLFFGFLVWCHTQNPQVHRAGSRCKGLSIVFSSSLFLSLSLSLYLSLALPLSPPFSLFLFSLGLAVCFSFTCSVCLMFTLIPQLSAAIGPKPRWYTTKYYTQVGMVPTVLARYSKPYEPFCPYQSLSCCVSRYLVDGSL